MYPFLGDELSTVVLDNGTGVSKVGLAGEVVPRVTFPSIIGRPRFRKAFNLPPAAAAAAAAAGEVFLGDQAQARRGVLLLSHPIERGNVVRWGDMEALWRHGFAALGADPAERPVLVAESPLSPKANREKTAEGLLEGLGVPALHMASQAVLALFATGRTTGVVLDVGEGVSHAVPVYEGFTLPYAIQRLPVAGRDVTDRLAQLLAKRRTALSSSAEKEIVRDIKEKLAYVAAEGPQAESGRAALRSQAEAALCADVDYELPDGNCIAVGEERFRCSEVLFDPSPLGLGPDCGLQWALLAAVNGCDGDLRRELLRNLVLAGGTTLMEGLPARLELELAAAAPASHSVRLAAPPERHCLAWLGGSVLATLPAFRSRCVTREEYDEGGASAIHRACF